jgi:hypothetical protein
MILIRQFASQRQIHIIFGLSPPLALRHLTLTTHQPSSITVGPCDRKYRSYLRMMDEVSDFVLARRTGEGDPLPF